MKLRNWKDPEDKDEKQKYFDGISRIYSPETAYQFASKLSDEDEGDWIIKEIPKFVNELENWNENWKKLSLRFGQPQKKILIVRRTCLKADPEMAIIRAICEILTRCGYCVRTDEISECEGCKLGMMSRNDGLKRCEGCKNFELYED